MNIEKKYIENLFIVGILGGVVAGKSTVSQLLHKKGAYIIQADEIGHTVLDMPFVQQELISLWGDDILIDGKLDRKKLSQIVFVGGKESLEKLESITHPQIKKIMEQKLSKIPSQSIVIFDVALLWEVGMDAICQTLLFIETPIHLREQRSEENRGWKKEEVTRREKKQKSLEEKRDKAQYIIHNNGNIEQLETQTQEYWKFLQKEKSSYFQKEKK